MKPLRLGVVQLTSTDALSDNVSTVISTFRQAVKAGAQLVVYPENTLYFRIRPGSSLMGPSTVDLAALQAVVNEGEAALMCTTALPGGGGKFLNSTLLFRPGRAFEIVYTKIHLFDVDVPGAPPVRESDHFAAGQTPRLLEFEGWKIGLSICYDLRFAELYGHYRQDADLILVPSAFLVPTGSAHWEVLLRARAIENQCFVAAPAQSGDHVAGEITRHTYGHSLVVDPWGHVLADLTGSPTVKVLELEPGALAKVRGQIPMASHRRL